jgi:prepilin-type N-terminal cleavage/methylation domain-containing protein
MQTRYNPERRAKRAAFTLIEMLVVVAITAVVGVAVSTMIFFFYQKNAFLLEQTASLDNSRRAILDAVRAIREASYGDDGSYPVAAAATSTLTFYADVDNDGSVERIRYYLLNNTLYRGVTNSVGIPPSYVGQPESTTTIASYVRNSTSTPLFTYYDDTGAIASSTATSTNVAQVAAVGISIWIDLNPNRAPNTFNLVETATLRNIGSH